MNLSSGEGSNEDTHQALYAINVVAAKLVARDNAAPAVLNLSAPKMK